MSGLQSNFNNNEDVVMANDDVFDIDEEMPFELIEHARAAVLELLPEQSRQKYNRTYNNFKDWQSRHGAPNVSNDSVLSYFHMLATSKNYKPTSLWAYHSMLKATLRTFENTDIGKFVQVTAYLKSKSSGYRSKKAQVFTEENLKSFIDAADDLSWLDVKVICIFGICGALRTDEFTRINMEDVESHGDLFLVKIHKTKTKVPRSFTINGVFARIVQKFIDLRPVDLKANDRFFTNYQRGKCTKQFIGKNKFSGMPRRIAEYLKLAEPERYTGHSFRLTSATILANSGADIETIMRHGGWRNETSAKMYIEDSLGYKARTGDMIHRSIIGSAFPSTNADISAPSTSVSISVPYTHDSVKPPGIRSSFFAPVTSSADIPVTVSEIHEDSLFDSAIPDDQLIEIVAIASQSHEESKQIVQPSDTTVTLSKINEGLIFDSAIADEQLIEIVDNASQSCQQVLVGKDDRKLAPRESTDKGIATSANSTVLTQSSYSSLSAILARTFKSVNFERLDNCTFNFNYGPTTPNTNRH